MRVAFLNWNRRREGGVEAYLNIIISAVRNAGHDVAFCYEIDRPQERLPIQVPPDTPCWCVEDLGVERAIAALRAWRPDVIYSHNLASVELERLALDIAPAVFFGHAYQGTCISGGKTFTVPVAKPCSRRFGWQCLLHFYPHRCGGLNPAKMWTLYRTQAHRLALIKRYKIVLTNSEHMRAEYIRHGLSPDFVVSFPYCVTPLRFGHESPQPRTTGRDWRLAFAGRMDALKGGRMLLQSLPLLRSRTDRPLRLILAGDGPSRKDWETVAAQIRHSTPDVTIAFPGWLANGQLAALFDESDLLVMPSLWPEPFGTVGVQAAIQGVPAAAFRVGGIPTWLVDGVTGHFAPGNPPTTNGLAEAILRCLEDPDHYFHLRVGAAEMSGRFSAEKHLSELIELLKTAALSK